VKLQAVQRTADLRGKIFRTAPDEFVVNIFVRNNEVIFFDCMRRIHTPPLWGETKGMYPETNSLHKQPYPGRSAAGLVDLFFFLLDVFFRPVEKKRFKAVIGKFKRFGAGGANKAARFVQGVFAATHAER